MDQNNKRLAWNEINRIFEHAAKMQLQDKVDFLGFIISELSMKHEEAEEQSINQELGLEPGLPGLESTEKLAKNITEDINTNNGLTETLNKP